MGWGEAGCFIFPGGSVGDRELKQMPVLGLCVFTIATIFAKRGWKGANVSLSDLQVRFP